jgi:hypothetical protein
MRKSTLLWLLLAAFCGTALYHTSQRVHDRRQQLAVLEREAAREEESVRVLQAEWSYLNQPARLEKLARQYLRLAPLRGAQFAAADGIALRSAAAPEPEKVAVKIIDRHPFLQQEPPAALKADSPAEKTAGNSRKFGDVMKSLGVGQ